MCNSSNGCSCLTIVLSVLIGIAVALSYFFGLIGSIFTVTIIVFAVAFLLLLAFLSIASFAAASGDDTALSECLCNNGRCLLAGIIGSLIVAIIGILVSTTASLPVALILLFLGGAFVSIMLLSVICLLRCLLNELCDPPCD